VVVKWADQEEESLHELQELRPAPNPGDVVEFKDEKITVLSYENNGENSQIMRPRKNIPKKAPVCTCISNCGRILYVSHKLRMPNLVFENVCF